MPWARVPDHEKRRAIAHRTVDRALEALERGDDEEANRVLTRGAHTTTALVLFAVAAERAKAGDLDSVLEEGP